MTFKTYSDRGAQVDGWIYCQIIFEGFQGKSVERKYQVTRSEMQMYNMALSKWLSSSPSLKECVCH